MKVDQKDAQYFMHFFSLSNYRINYWQILENKSYFSEHLWTIYSTIGLISHMQFTNGNSNHRIFCLLVMTLMDEIRHTELETN